MVEKEKLFWHIRVVYTSIIIPWLKENYDYEVIAVAVDVGQGEELNSLHEKAIKLVPQNYILKI